VITNDKLVVLIFGLVSIDILLFISWMALGYLRPMVEASQLALQFHHFYICQSPFATHFISIIFALNGIKILVLVFFSKQSRSNTKNMREFIDSAAVQYSIFIIFIIVIFTVLFYALGNFTPLFKTIFIAIVTYLTIIATIGLIFFPIFTRKYKTSKSSTNRSRGSKTTNNSSKSKKSRY